MFGRQMAAEPATMRVMNQVTGRRHPARPAHLAHPGGTLNELLTVYTIVNALTVNLPAVTAVQVLVDGKEVDTLSGHIDLRQPLSKNLNWVLQP